MLNSFDSCFGQVAVFLKPGFRLTLLKHALNYCIFQLLSKVNDALAFKAVNVRQVRTT